jgi:hypothetical protein
MATGDHCQSLHSLLIRWALNLDLMMIDTHERQFGQAKVGSVLAASQSSADPADSELVCFCLLLLGSHAQWKNGGAELWG